MRVVVLHNAVSEQDAIEDQDVLVQVESVSQSLERLGHEYFAVACTLDLSSMQEKLRQLRPDVIFNLVEGLQGDDSLVYLPPAVLDALGLPYAGNRADALFLTTNKILAKERLTQAGLPTPDWITPRDKGESNNSVTVDRWIIKGVWDQASRDLDDDAVFRGDQREARQRLAQKVRRTGRPAFAEQYIEGREFNLALLTDAQGVRVLPPAEIDFSAFPPEKPRIVGHRAKWRADSFEYHNTPRRFDFPAADQALLECLQNLARDCWKLFALGGWARVDFRVDQSGRPWILEVNGNPCLSPDAGFAAALQQAGIAFDEAIACILEEALLNRRSDPLSV